VATYLRVLVELENTILLAFSQKNAALALQPHKTSPTAAYPPLLAPPPALRVEYTSWGTPRPLGGTVRPVTAPCGKLEGRQRRLRERAER